MTKTSKLVLLLVVIAAAVLTVLFFLVSPLSWRLDDELARQALPGAGPDPEPSPQLAPSPSGPAVNPGPVPETFEVFTARDPFQQLVLLTPPPSQPAAPAPTPSPLASGSPGPVSPAAPTSNARIGATSVKLVDVFDAEGSSAALVTVNGSGYEVREADEFAGSFRALDISGACATFLFGDSRFTLCEGEQIRA